MMKDSICLHKKIFGSLIIVGMALTLTSSYILSLYVIALHLNNTYLVLISACFITVMLLLDSLSLPTRESTLKIIFDFTAGIISLSLYALNIFSMRNSMIIFVVLFVLTTVISKFVARRVS